jgi:flagellum-specific ATP synthase
MSVLSEQLRILDHAAPLELRGTVSEVRGLALRVDDLPAPIGAMVSIYEKNAKYRKLEGEVVGFDCEQAIVMPLGATTGVRRGDRVVADHFTPMVRVGESLLGRILDGMGRPIDGRGPLTDSVIRPLSSQPVDPLDRPLINEPLATGVRSIDALMSVGRGQRIGVFAAPGVGKSTLLGMMARHTAADVSVIALVGERGREVRDFIDSTLGPEGLARSVVVCATSDQPALLRIRAAVVAAAIAEYFRDRGLDAMLIMDSVTRFCQAQRQVGLAAGEPPATKGYPPSVFAMLPTLLERSGRTSKGSITGIYSVLVEGDDINEPISDACRGILDGHIQLSRDLAQQGHYPAIDVLNSVSRVVDDVTGPEQQNARRQVLKLIHNYRQVEDLLNIGAYAPGSNPEFDIAIACKPSLDRLLQQGRGEVRGAADFNKAKSQLLALIQQVQQAQQQLSQKSRQPAQQAAR